MRFFKPNHNFWSWIMTFSTRRIVDVGCGDGDLVREMMKAGLRPVGIDPRYIIFDMEIPKDLFSLIVPLAADSVPEMYQEDNVILCCRPCHNGFPADVVAMKAPTADFFYIGFEKNLDVDVGNEFFRHLVEQDVGEDGENIYRISP